MWDSVLNNVMTLKEKILENRENVSDLQNQLNQALREQNKLRQGIIHRRNYLERSNKEASFKQQNPQRTLGTVKSFELTINESELRLYFHFILLFKYISKSDIRKRSYIF